MTKTQFITFQKFDNQDSAFEVGTLLKEHNIEYVLEEDSLSFDPTFSSAGIAKEFRLKLQKQDFEKAENLLQQIILSQIDAVESDYYLFEFTDEELIEIIIKRYEWGQFDFLLAQKLLKDRGKEIKQEVVELLRKQRIQELAKPEETGKPWIYAGYIMALLGGFLGIVIGFNLLTNKKTLPNGDIVYAHSESDRKHGIKIVIIGSIFLAIWMTVRIVDAGFR